MENIDFDSTYAVDMHCESCTKDIENCLKNVDGIKSVSFDLNDKLMNVKGHAAPSAIINALQECGRESIIRGTGKPNSAAVSILEEHDSSNASGVNPVLGLARIVEVADKKTFFDININGVKKPGLYYASVRSSGDLTDGVKSSGDALYKLDTPIDCSKPSDSIPNTYSGNAFILAPYHVWEILGRSFVVTSNPEHKVTGADDISVGGVIARSAGAWENTKQVCACSGKTLWQERKDAIQHNIRF